MCVWISLFCVQFIIKIFLGQIKKKSITKYKYALES